MTAAKAEPAPDPTVTNHAAALRVLWVTRVDDDTPGPDARELMEMLGLVRGHDILPDDTRSYDDVHGSATRNPDDNSFLSRPLPAHGTPEGAATLHADGVLCVRCQSAVDRARSIAEQAAASPPRPPGRPRQPRKASTSATASTAAPRPAPPAAAKRRPSTTDRKPPTHDPRCGRPEGYDAHRTRGEEACTPCRAAAAQRQRDYVDRKRAEQGLPPVTRRGSVHRPASAAPKPKPAPPKQPRPAPVPDPPAPSPFDVQVEAFRRAAAVTVVALRQLTGALEALTTPPTHNPE